MPESPSVAHFCGGPSNCRVCLRAEVEALRADLARVTEQLDVAREMKSAYLDRMDKAERQVADFSLQLHGLEAIAEDRYQVLMAERVSHGQRFYEWKQALRKVADLEAENKRLEGVNQAQAQRIEELTKERDEWRDAYKGTTHAEMHAEWQDEREAMCVDKEADVARITALESQVRHLQQERDQLRAFAQGVMEGWPEDAGDVDGGTLQDLAAEHGLLRPETRTEPCGGNCFCASYHGEFPVECYRVTNLLRPSSLTSDPPKGQTNG